MSVSEEQIKSGLELCPRCGCEIGSSSDNPSAPSVADTQTINVRDMARMAQQGVDLEVSGEWDTSVVRRADKSRHEDDSQ